MMIHNSSAGRQSEIRTMRLFNDKKCVSYLQNLGTALGT